MKLLNEVRLSIKPIFTKLTLA